MGKGAGEEIPEEIWYDMWKTHQTTTQSTRLRELDWKNLICYLLFKMKSKQMNAQQPHWRLCNHIQITLIFF